MAAYDQVLAKLKNVGGPSAPDSALPGVPKSKKRKQPSANALPLAKATQKLKSSEEATVPASDEIASPGIETAARADSGSQAKALARTEMAVPAKASHLARFGRRRAGKNVRRYPQALDTVCACRKRRSPCVALRMEQ